jgi:hypothetical protein
MSYIQGVCLSPPADLPFVKKYVALLFLSLIIAPVTVCAANYLLGDRRGNWQTADRSSAGLLPNASIRPDALIRVFAARTVRWRGVFAVHTCIPQLGLTSPDRSISLRSFFSIYAGYHRRRNFPRPGAPEEMR